MTKPPKETRDLLFNFRISPDDKRTFENRARKAGKTLSDYVREKLALDDPPKWLEAQLNELAATYHLDGGWEAMVLIAVDFLARRVAATAASCGGRFVLLLSNRAIGTFLSRSAVRRPQE